MGLLDEEPHVRVSGAQAAGCSPVATAFAEGTDAIRPVKPAHHRQVPGHRQPGRRLVRARRHPPSGGSCASVTDDEVIEGIKLLARTEGIFAETAGGVTIATLAKLAAPGRGPLRRAGRGPGHRARAEDGRGPDRIGRPTATIAPTLEAFDEAMGDDDLPSRAERDEESQMSIKVRIPTQLRTLTGGEGRSPWRVPRWARPSRPSTPPTPGSPSGIFDEQRGLRRFVNVFLADEDVRFLEGLATPVADGQTLSIVPAVAGG